MKKTGRPQQQLPEDLIKQFVNKGLGRCKILTELKKTGVITSESTIQRRIKEMRKKEDTVQEPTKFIDDMINVVVSQRELLKENKLLKQRIADLENKVSDSNKLTSKIIELQNLLAMRD